MNPHFHPETLAEYVAGDLHGAEAQSIERHLQECERCRLVLDQLRDAAGALGRFVTETPAPLEQTARKRVPSPRWGAAAAAVLLLLMVTAGGSLAAPYIAKTWEHMIAREIPKAEAPKQIEHIRESHEEVQQQSQFRYLTPAEAEHQREQLGLAQVTALPPGYTLIEARVSGKGSLQVLQKFESGKKFIHVSQLWTTGLKVLVDYPEGSGREVEVGGGKGLLVEGNWMVYPDGKNVWLPHGHKTLHFEWNGQQVNVVASHLSVEELIQVAESLQ